MSKRKLKLYLKDLSKPQLEEQILDLYNRFKEVKIFYNFAFNPSEDKLLNEAKFKINKEYFPINGRKPKKRRSVAQKLIKHYIQLEADPFMVAEIMVFNIETAQKYCKQNPIKQESFYTSILKSYDELISFTADNGIESDFAHRIERITYESEAQNWFNAEGFRRMTIG